MTAELETILERHRRDPLQLLQILIELQARDGWLAPAALGLMTVIFGVGQAMGPYLAGVLADSTRSFAPAFAIAGTIALLLGAGGSLMLRTSTNLTGGDL